MDAKLLYLTSGGLCGRRNRVVLAPQRLGAKLAMMLRITPMTVAIGKVHRGERAISRKPLRRGGRLLPPVPVVFALFAQLFARGPRVHAATRPSLRPQLSRRATTDAKLGRNAPREREAVSAAYNIVSLAAARRGFAAPSS